MMFSQKWRTTSYEYDEDMKLITEISMLYYCIFSWYCLILLNFLRGDRPLILFLSISLFLIFLYTHFNWQKFFVSIMLNWSQCFNQINCLDLNIRFLMKNPITTLYKGCDSEVCFESSVDYYWLYIFYYMCFSLSFVKPHIFII